MMLSVQCTTHEELLALFDAAAVLELKTSPGLGDSWIKVHGMQSKLLECQAAIKGSVASSVIIQDPAIFEWKI